MDFYSSSSWFSLSFALIANAAITQINPTTTIHNTHRITFNQDGNPDVPVVFVVSTGGIVFVSQYLLLTS